MMARLGSWIEPFSEGIYVRPADAWIDPSQPKPLALVTHGHADHARGGHGEVIATPETLAIMECRYGPQAGRPIAYGEMIRIGEVDISFVPAGHVLGSAQIVLDHKGERIVVSGGLASRQTIAPTINARTATGRMRSHLLIAPAPSAIRARRGHPATMRRQARSARRPARSGSPAASTTA